MKLLQSHEGYIKSVLEDLFYKKLNITRISYHPFDNNEDWLKYSEVFFSLDYVPRTHG